MYDASTVAKAVEFYLQDDAATLRGKPGSASADLIAVIETATVQVTGENEVTGRVVNTNDGMAWSTVMKDAMEKAAAEAAPDAEIISNTPVEWLLEW